MNNDKFFISLDKIGYKTKPNGKEIGSIRNRLSGSTSHTELSLEALAATIRNGQTIQGALLRDIKANENTDDRFIKQQIFCIDIDNDTKGAGGKKYKSKNSLDTPEEILKICKKANIKPCIISESFSSGTVDPDGKKIYKYHALFAAEYPVEDVTTARNILLNLQRIFSEYADKACKDPARIIFGTSKDKNIYVYEDVNSIKSLLPPAPAPSNVKPLHTTKKIVKTREEADPDILLDMIDPNNLDYNEWIRVSAAYKSYPNADFSIWRSWSSQYIKDNQRADENTYKGLTGKGITKGSLKHFAQLHSPEAYIAYMNQLNHNIEHSTHSQMPPKSSSSAKPPIAPQQQKQEQWGEIKPFESSPEAIPFPIDSFPPLLRDYLKALAAYSAVSFEMGVLPILSVLSLCLQGKAVVNYPGNEHLEPLCLYTLTIAEPGERKTSVFSELLKPIDEFERQYNESHEKAIKDYIVQKKFYENQLNRELNSKNGDLNRAKQLQQDLDSLQPVQRLKLYLTDTTPEALARELSSHNEKMGIMGDEATILKILSGIYSKNGVNYDIILNCYDGKKYTLSRQTSEDITLFNPLLTISSMVQPQPFKEVMSNREFSGKGLLQRFLFAFPPSKAGYQPFQTPNIPANLKSAYSELIINLLRMKQDKKPPILRADKEAYLLFADYHNTLQHKMRAGGVFDNMKDYANKQLSKALRIAALLHLTQYKTTDLINGKTALNAISMCIWFENQALKAFEFDTMSDIEKAARYVYKRLQEYLKKKNNLVLKKSEFQNLCRSNKYNKEMLNQTLELLDDMNVLKYIIETQERGRARETIIINPAISSTEI